MRGWGLLATVLALAVACSLALASYATSSKLYSKHGVSFVYPPSWSPIKPGTVSAKRGSQLWTEWLGPAVRSRKAVVVSDLVMLTAYRTPVAVTAKNVRLHADEIARSVAAVARRAGGRLLSGPQVVRMGGLPGYGFRIRATVTGGTRIESRLVLVWKGKTELFLNCQHRLGGARKGEVEQGCRTIIGSFRAGS